MLYLIIGTVNWNEMKKIYISKALMELIMHNTACYPLADTVLSLNSLN